MNKENQEQINLILDKIASEFEAVEMRDLIEEIKKLINENIELKEENSKLRDKVEQLQDRIDSAINYAEEHNWGYAGIDEEHADKLINILKGE